MALCIKQLELHNFRNYRDYRCADLAQLNIFVGPNAVGKTNLVEGISLLTSMTSFRNAHVSELLGPHEDFARVAALVEGESRCLELELRLNAGKKKYLLNGKEKPATRLRGTIPSVSFTPDDLTMVKGPHAQRRRALDALGAQLAPSYPSVRRDFEQMLRHKNNLLKEDCSPMLLESVNETFAAQATMLYCFRASLFEKLAPYICDYYRDIAQRDENVTAYYLPSWLGESVSRETFSRVLPDCHDKESVRCVLDAAIKENSYRELAAKRTLIGPHKDEIRFCINGRDSSVFASQGQQRSLVLAWKLAEVSLVEDMLSVKPLLLLDDVMSELDEVRRNELTKYVLESTQTFITTTNLGYFAQSMVDQARIINLEYEPTVARG